MRLTFVISSLEPGGAERVASTMANHWAARGRPVTILTLDDGSRPPFYDLDGGVRRVALELAAVSPNRLVGSWRNAMRARVVRRAIRNSRPDAVIAFTDTTNVLVLMATRGLAVPVLVAEHTDPILHDIGVAWRVLRAVAYRRAAQIVVLNERARGYFGARLRARTSVIPNPVAGAPSDGGPRRAGSLIVGMGRLDHEKGHDLLLRAFARVAPSFPEWRVMVLGEGPQRRALEELRDELRLTDRVEFAGLVRNPHAVLGQADLFVHPSRQEAFPMALCEAMACGLPVVAAEYHSGVRDIVRDGVDGVIVPPEDVDALAAAMAGLMADEAARRRLAAQGRQIVERYGVARIMGMWDDLLERVTGNRAGGP